MSHARKPLIFRRDWGDAAQGTIDRLDVALDAITPLADDRTMRILLSRNEPVLHISIYEHPYFEGKPVATRQFPISKRVFQELKDHKYILGISLTDPAAATMWMVSDEGEAAWRELIYN